MTERFDNLSPDYPPERIAREQELARICWQREELRNTRRKLMNNPYDIDHLRALAAADNALMDEMEDHELLKELRIHCEQLEQNVRQLIAQVYSINRVLNFIVGGSLFFGIVLLFIALMPR